MLHEKVIDENEGTEAAKWKHTQDLPMCTTPSWTMCPTESGAPTWGLSLIHIFMGITVAFSVVLAVGLFMILPYFISLLFHRFTDSDMVIAVAEGVVRLTLFIGYILLISRMKDIQRVFMYHGAEHKCINCIEPVSYTHLVMVLSFAEGSTLIALSTSMESWLMIKITGVRTLIKKRITPA